MKQVDAFVHSVMELQRNGNDVYVLAADFGSRGLDEFKLQYPHRYLNVGIAEQNLVNAVVAWF